jgi:hypothetical protein
MKPQLPAYQALVFDAGYGVIVPLLADLENGASVMSPKCPAILRRGRSTRWPP